MATIRLISVGSRGDLHPYLTILLELRRRGHAVSLIGSPNFRGQAEANQLEFVPLAGDFRALMRSDQGKALMQGKPARLVSDDLLVRWLNTSRPGIAGTDLLLVTPLTLWGYHLAEAEQCRLVVLSPFPIATTGAFAFMRFPGPEKQPHVMRRMLNRLSYRLPAMLSWFQESKVTQPYRQQVLGLPRLPWVGARYRLHPPASVENPVLLHLFSSRVLPVPPDWPANASATGFCVTHTDGSGRESSFYKPSLALQAFLDAGPAPFYAGFGSMIPADPERLGEIVVNASELAGQRLVLAPGWGLVMPDTVLPPSVFLLGECPHTWLFPRLRGAVHHGGAGTTASTLYSGIPSTVVAFIADQRGWGHTLERLGVSPATHQASSVSTKALAQSIRMIASDCRFRQRARQLRDALAHEDGVATTATAIEAQLRAFRQKQSEEK